MKKRILTAILACMMTICSVGVVNAYEAPAKYNLPDKPVIEFYSQYMFTIDGKTVINSDDAENSFYTGSPLPVIEVSDEVMSKLKSELAKADNMPSEDVISKLEVKGLFSDGSMLIYYDRKDVHWPAMIEYEFLGEYLNLYSPHALLYKDGVFCPLAEGYNSGLISEQTKEEIAALKKLPKYVGIDEEKMAGLYLWGRGDFNYNLSMDINDATYLQRYLADQYAHSYRTEFFGDINGDGKTNILDVTAMQNEIIS